MTEKRFNSYTLTVLLIGLIMGFACSFLLSKKFNSPALVGFEGIAIQDTASHDALYLNGAIILQEAKLNENLIYLRFQDNATMNAAIGKKVTASGNLTNITLDNGQNILQLNVTTIEQLKID